MSEGESSNQVQAPAIAMGKTGGTLSRLLDDNSTIAMLCLTVLGIGCIVSVSLGHDVKDPLNVLIGAVGGMAMGKFR